jgi:hypothetical protein
VPPAPVVSPAVRFAHVYGQFVARAGGQPKSQSWFGDF